MKSLLIITITILCVGCDKLPGHGNDGPEIGKGSVTVFHADTDAYLRAVQEANKP